MSKLTFKTSIDFVYGKPKIMVPGVRRIVANNPSSFTFKGTNTYIVGQGNDVAVIDPGPKDDYHYSAIMAATVSKQITHIFVTHTHLDHVDGLKSLAEATGATICGCSHSMCHGNFDNSSMVYNVSSDVQVFPTIQLYHGSQVNGSDWSLTAIFTPGHAPDHLCFELKGTGILFSGDHVMGWSTSLIAPPEGHMGDYFASLEMLARRNDVVYYPGHGGQIEQPKRLVKAYILHRKVREKIILAAVQNGCCTITDIVTHTYKRHDPNLTKAVLLTVQAHIEHLSQQKLVNIDCPVTKNSRIVASKVAR
ncbi:MAG: MBL fold metallo-hydrolase [Hyphomicrobiaceae bacterium]|nr:MBL fold metallo-hydrolase [Hyphomicrobiaceae bacterium]